MMPDAQQNQLQHTRLWRSAWLLTVATIAWNVVEAGVAIAGGVAAGSVALVGFGLDSVIEVSSALVIAWRLAQESADRTANERAERLAVRLIGGSFFAIAAYVTYESITTLLGFGERPAISPAGLALVTLSLIVMPVLAWAKRRVADRLGSVALKADAAETLLCTYLSAIVLAGLAANSLFDWWWLDAVAGLGVAAFAVNEGREAWEAGNEAENEE